MNQVKSGVLSFIASVVAVLAMCSNDNPANDGNTGSRPAISGILYNADGSICTNARVAICAKNNLADTGSGAPGKNIAPSLTTTTDNSGRYSFDVELEPDYYVVDAKSGSNAVLIDSVKVSPENSSIVVAAATLQPAGAIKGSVRLTQGGDMRNVYVLAFGIDRFTRVNADGNFFFGNLAQGRYTLRLTSGLNDYGAFTTENIDVHSAETTSLEPITLPGRDTLLPQNFVLAYDTMQQLVTLRWNRSESAGENGYSIYKRNAGPDETFGVPLINLFTDTIFVDSMCYQDQIYDYCVAAVFGENQAERTSDVRAVKINSYLSVDTVFTASEGDSAFNFLSTIAIAPSGDIFLPVVQGGYIGVCDLDMREKGIVATDIFQVVTIRFADDRLFVQQLDQVSWRHNVLRYSTSGVFIDTLVKNTGSMMFDTDYGLLAMAYHPDSLGFGDSLSVISVDGTYKKTWNCEAGFNYRSVCIAGPDKIFAAVASDSSSQSKIVVFDRSGTVISEKIFAETTWLSGLAYDAERQLLFVAADDKKRFQQGGKTEYSHQMTGIIKAYDNSFSQVARYTIMNTVGSPTLALHKNGSLYVGVLGMNAGPQPTQNRIIRLNPVER